MTELQIVPSPPSPDLPSGVTHVPSVPGKPVVVLTAVIGGTTQTWYVVGDDNDALAAQLPRVHRYIQELRKRFGGEELPGPSAPVGHAAPSVPADEPLHDCQWHGQMKRSTKVPGTQFCSHRMADGSYCKEKWPTRAVEKGA